MLPAAQGTAALAQGPGAQRGHLIGCDRQAACHTKIHVNGNLAVLVGLAQTVYIRSIFVLVCAKISKYTGYIYGFGQPKY